MTLTAEALDIHVPQQDSCEVGVRASVASVIAATVRSVSAGQGKSIAPLTDDLVLLESGLDSLCFAIIVATLEDELGYDPFTAAEDVFFPATFGEFVRFYERGL
jgi:acyl carrier protein